MDKQVATGVALPLDGGEFVRALPKAELHVHLEGTLQPAALLDLAARNDVAVPWSSEDEVRRAYVFQGLEDFLALYFHGCRVLRRERDFYELTLDHLRRSAAGGVVRAEMFFGPQTWTDLGVSVAEQLSGVLAAIEDARREWGIDGALLISAHRHRGEQAALDLLYAIEPWAGRIIGVGLGGAEVGHPPQDFARYFQRARSRGYRTCCHAGEEGPADYVRQAIDVCGVDRVDHGVAAARDPVLLARLAAEQVPLTVCPLSNLRLGVVDSLAHHPIGRIQAAGVLVTVNSDDPAYFGGDVNDNYQALAVDLGFDRDRLAGLARNSLTASFAPADRVAAWTSLLEERTGMSDTP